MLSLSIIYACFYVCSLEFFVLSIIIVSQPLTPLRRLLRLQSVTQAPTAAMCKPDACHGLVCPGGCCHARPASASCISGSFDQIGELTTYDWGVNF